MVITEKLACGPAVISNVYRLSHPGKIKIQDILACGFLDDLLEVCKLHCMSFDPTD